MHKNLIMSIIMYLSIIHTYELKYFFYTYLKTKFIIKNDDSSILSHLYKLNTIIYMSLDNIFILFNRIVATHYLRIYYPIYLLTTHIMFIGILFYNLCLLAILHVFGEPSLHILSIILSILYV